jgi:hypothetical protein
MSYQLHASNQLLAWSFFISSLPLQRQPGLWAEATAYPAVYLTDPRLQWEAVDNTTASLHVPFGDEG